MSPCCEEKTLPCSFQAWLSNNGALQTGAVAQGRHGVLHVHSRSHSSLEDCSGPTATEPSSRVIQGCTPFIRSGKTKYAVLPCVAVTSHPEKACFFPPFPNCQQLQPYFDLKSQISPSCSFFLGITHPKKHGCSAALWAISTRGRGKKVCYQLYQTHVLKAAVSPACQINHSQKSEPIPKNMTAQLRHTHYSP